VPLLDENRLLPTDAAGRQLGRRLYETIKDLPIISPHGHVDPSWFAENLPFANPTELFITPDHYVLRMLVSQGISFDDLGIPNVENPTNRADPRGVWDIFAAHYHLFRGTPSQLWLDHVFQEQFGFGERLSAANSSEYYDEIDARLSGDAFRPRALFEQFNIEVLATTESALDPLAHHQAIAKSDWPARIISTYRPDAVIDPEDPQFNNNLKKLGELTGENVETWNGYLNAHRNRRAYFKSLGTTATDHGHPSAVTANLSHGEAAALFDQMRRGDFTAAEAETFRGQMLTEMARMSLEDGLVMQLHPGSNRNHSPVVMTRHGRDMGFDIPQPTNYVTALKPLLDAVGMEASFRLILFTLDETSMSRELAPLAGAYPSLRLGPAWWFYDSAAGMRRYREAVTETCGFYNTVGFNDDTRALMSIPARHDVARRVDCAYLADLVTTGRLGESDAFEVAEGLTYSLAKEAYRL
jgi:glucuronate isomerase